MTIPERLKLRPASDELVEEMSALCDAIEQKLEAGESAEALLQQWHSHATRKCDPYEFQTYWEAVSQETFVREVLNPEPIFDNDATYSEVLAVLDAVASAAVPPSETSYYLGWLEAQFPSTNMNDLIFWPDLWLGDTSYFRNPNRIMKRDLSNDQILGYAMAKSGRRLPGAPQDVTLPFPMPK